MHCRMLILVAMLVIAPAGIFSQEYFRVMFYNVENLFDTKDDSLKSDNDFLPDGNMRWTPWKYWEKLRNITRVITAVGEMQSPALVGMCEVENDSVLFDLTQRSPLRMQDYSYIVSNSPDERGIDVALLYQRHQFRLLDYKEYTLTLNKQFPRPTRNILHAVGNLINGDTLDVFVCHFPSRSEGQKETEPFRVAAATLLRKKVDSLFHLRDNANILIMGDFNDHPDNISLSVTLQAKVQEERPDNKSLYNLFYKHLNEPEFGTYKYQGRWEVLDQFIVSGNMLTPSNRTSIVDSNAIIFKADFLLEDDSRYYGKKPFRTNLGPRYQGGFSDHLPIYMDVNVAL
jgi:exonuclease III